MIVIKGSRIVSWAVADILSMNRLVYALTLDTLVLSMIVSDVNNLVTW